MATNNKGPALCSNLGISIVILEEDGKTKTKRKQNRTKKAEMVVETFVMMQMSFIMGMHGAKQRYRQMLDVRAIRSSSRQHSFCVY
jgi:hypothetical protein